MPFADVIGHDGPKRKIQTALDRHTIGHAYLFSGDEGIGKRLMAVRFAQALSCETPPASSQPDSCGECRACRQVAAGTYPDVLMIQPEREKANPQIKIDQVREIERHMIYRPLFSSHKICIIDDADRLTTNAANAFLKTLEDPPDHSVFVLVTSQAFRLLATVRSRCLTLRFSPATSMQFEGALALKRAVASDEAKFLAQISGNRIGMAFGMDTDQLHGRHDHFFQLCGDKTPANPTTILQRAEDLSKTKPFPDVLEWLTHGLRDLLLVSIGAKRDLLLHQKHVETLHRVAESVDPAHVVELAEFLQTLEQAPRHNLNLQLALENFLLRFHQVIRRAA